MSKLAAAVARELADSHGLTIVGVTGSAGKTSTKDLIAAVLSRAGETVAPPGSFNNEIGHPYTVLRCTEDTDFLVAEMSARGIGHIAHLATIAPPKIGVVLNVGSAHIGEFGSRENIAKAKGELVEALPDTGVAVLNADDELVAGMADRTDARVVTFSESGNTAADYYATGVELDAVARASFTMHTPNEQPQRVTLGVFGAHQVGNALAAAAVGTELGMDAATVAEALSAASSVSVNRMDVNTRADGVTVINDAYNANPESMRAALRTLATLGRSSGRRTWAVLGEMLELGDARVREHTLVGESVVRLNIAQLLVVGAGARPLYIGALNEGSWGEEAHFVDDAAQAEAFLAEHLRPGDLVLVKSSNGVGLAALGERLATADAVAAPSASPKESRP